MSAVDRYDDAEEMLPFGEQLPVTGGLHHRDGGQATTACLLSHLARNILKTLPSR